MSAHTPGPWRVVEAEQHIDVQTTEGEPIVRVGTLWTHAEVNEQDRANAKLIAAAPDLWAALREAAQCAPHAFMCTPSVELRERLKGGEIVEMTLGKELPGCDCWKSRAAAAIAKAEGRP